MTAKIVRFKPEKEKIRAERAALTRDMVQRELEPLAEALQNICAALDPHTEPTKNKWPFVIISSSNVFAVADWLSKDSIRPMAAVLLWLRCLDKLDHSTGEILQSRDELAAAVGIFPRDVSTIMTKLVERGAISRRRMKIRGMQGPGVVRYFLNPAVGTAPMLL